MACRRAIHFDGSMPHRVAVYVLGSGEPRHAADMPEVSVLEVSSRYRLRAFHSELGGSLYTDMQFLATSPVAHDRRDDDAFFIPLLPWISVGCCLILKARARRCRQVAIV